MRTVFLSILFLGVLACCLTSVATPIKKQRPDSEIEGIMRAGFGGYPPIERPIKRAVEGKATKEDFDRLTKLCADLNKATPPHGDAEEWKKVTEELSKSLKGVIDNRNDESLARLKKASDCKDCHDKFKATAEEEAQRIKDYKSKQPPQ